jgi:hypothetical protein
MQLLRRPATPWSVSPGVAGRLFSFHQPIAGATPLSWPDGRPTLRRSCGPLQRASPVTSSTRSQIPRPQPPAAITPFIARRTSARSRTTTVRISRRRGRLLWPLCFRDLPGGRSPEAAHHGKACLQGGVGRCSPQCVLLSGTPTTRPLSRLPADAGRPGDHPQGPASGKPRRRFERSWPTRLTCLGSERLRSKERVRARTEKFRGLLFGGG